MPEYKGKCDHEMIHRILTDHHDKLEEHEREALKELRQGIHKHVKSLTNIKVTIYLDTIEPIVITNGKGENQLIIHIKKDGKVDFDWVQKTAWEKGKEFVQDVASKLLNTIVDTLLSILGDTVKKAITSGGQKAIKWVTG